MQDVNFDGDSRFSKDHPLLMPTQPPPAGARVAVPDRDLLSDTDSDDGSVATTLKASWIPVGVVAFAVIISSIFIYFLIKGDRMFDMASLIFDLMAKNPFAGFVGFVSLYTFNALICLPVFPLILGIGFCSVHANGIFPGIPLGCLQVAIAAVFASTVVYAVGSSICRSQVLLLARRSKAVHVEELLMKHKGFQIVALLRMTSFLPFGASSYALSATSVQFRDYFLGTLFGVAPFTIVEVSAGASLSSFSYATVSGPSLNAAPVEEQVSRLPHFLFVFSFSLAVFASWYISRLARAELRAIRARHTAGELPGGKDISAYKSFVEHEFALQPEPTPAIPV